jgi:transposase, IS5 family
MTNDEAKILIKWQLLSPYLDRRQQSLWAAAEAETLGHGGARLLSMLTGIPLNTIKLRRRKLRPTIAAAAESRTRGQRSGRFGRPRMEIKDPLKAISRFLDDQPDLTERIRGDLLRGLKKPGSGRGGLTPGQVLRSLVLMRLKNWDYRELRERIDDGLTLRQFTDFYCALVPKHDAFQRSFVRLRPQTVKAINGLIVRAAVELGLENGAKLRVDTTVVQTNIHHPTDDTLLWDVVRVTTRLVRRLANALKLRRIKGFCDRRRSARRRMYEIQRITTRRRHEQQARIYRVLIGIAEAVVGNARAALEMTDKMRGRDRFADMAIEEFRKQIEHFCALGSRVIDQARRRMLDGEQVPNSEKIYSIFEPHTDLIKRGKVRTPIEFGHKVFLAESEQGLITQYEVLNGNPPDELHVAPSLRRHRQAFGRVPELYGSDRGFFNEQNLTSCKQEGVKVVCIPQRGGKKTAEREAYEKSADFKQGRHFRAGIEGRISVLLRGRGMKRCLAQGRDRFELLVGTAVLANNLMRVADLLAKQSSRTRKVA